MAIINGGGDRIMKYNNGDVVDADIINQAIIDSETALGTADIAYAKAESAGNSAYTANGTANSAITKATTAETNSSNALNTANSAKLLIDKIEPRVTNVESRLISECHSGAIITAEDTCKGVASVSVGSKNLFDVNSSYDNNFPDKIKILNNLIVLNGSLAGYDVVKFAVDLKVGTYTISAIGNGTLSKTYDLIYLCIKNKNNVILGRLYEMFGEYNTIGKKLIYTNEFKSYQFNITAQDLPCTVSLYSGGNLGGNLYDNFTMLYQIENNQNINNQTAFTPFLPNNTAIDITSGGKNLINKTLFTNYMNTQINQLVDGIKVIALTTVSTHYASIIIPTVIGHQYYFQYKARNEINATKLAGVYKYVDDAVVSPYLYNTNGGSFIAEGDTCFIELEVHTPTAAGASVEFYDIMLEQSNRPTNYQPYISQSKSTTIGASPIAIQQYYGTTNLSTNNKGAVINAEIKIDTLLYANRAIRPIMQIAQPTDMVSYPRMWIKPINGGAQAYYCEKDADGSVVANWIKIIQ